MREMRQSSTCHQSYVDQSVAPQWLQADLLECQGSLEADARPNIFVEYLPNKMHSFSSINESVSTFIAERSLYIHGAVWNPHANWKDTADKDAELNYEPRLAASEAFAFDLLIASFEKNEIFVPRAELIVDRSDNMKVMRWQRCLIMGKLRKLFNR